MENKTVKRAYNKNYMWFKVDLKNGKELIVEIKRHEPKTDNHYGNGTCVSVDVNGAKYMLLDTRYETSFDTVEGYRDYMTNWVMNHWGNNAIEITQAF